ncbi:hypothetical protein A1OK_18500 [Enterovibrio norvegicus FF-454]|uniref:BIG2 domain-containing protein n=1 Tax=Enterovibrio norvegicus FF-454 TaxID=1185651 RepID=A0A1E5CE62_9GAMM|nr:hypothetical protein A1OK_18500 [Enterovibrio norvegicus FF-454]
MVKVVYQGFIVLLCLHLAGCNGDFIWIGSNSDQSTDTAQTAPNSIDIQTDGETGAQILLQLSPGQTLQLKVITSSAPLSKSTLNNGVVWTSSDNSVLSVSSTGLVKALSLGSAFITATVGGRSSNAFGLDVVPPYIVSLELTPELNGINPQVGGSNAITSTMEYDASQTFTVTGTYNEGTVSDVSNSVTMNISDSGIATFSGPQMNAMAAGTSEVTASIGSITSNIVTVTTTSLSLCGGAVDDASSNTATGVCLKVIAETVTENLFTGTPSEALMLHLGYTADTTSTNSGKTYESFQSDSSVTGSPENFARFQNTGLNWDDDFDSSTYGKDGAYDRYCSHLASIRFNYRDNWRRTTVNEITSLRTKMGNLTSGYGWAGALRYGSSTETNSGKLFARSLTGTHRTSFSPSVSVYASCISVP